MPSLQLGIEVFLEDKSWKKKLKNKKIGLVCHPASLNQNLEHSFDSLFESFGLSCAFGPQHGVKGNKQYNMIETHDDIDPVTGLPLFSLYGKVRKPTPEMMKHLDVMVFDLQDLGCRIYTYITTLLYVMQACAENNKSLIVLDRPNPLGRGVEGMKLEPGWESFVGAAPIPMRHGLTVAEMALYYQNLGGLKNLDLHVVKMKGYSPSESPGFGWPQALPWINPSPNAATLNMARVYPGTVLIEGTHLSEGRGTTRPLEVVGAPKLNVSRILERMQKLDARTHWLKGLAVRECYFEPTFYNFKGELCNGLMLHADLPDYKPQKAKPYRVMALFFKALRQVEPEFNLYRDFVYEYVHDRLSFDVINGGPGLRQWIEDSSATTQALEKKLKLDETTWLRVSRKFWIY